MRKPAISAGNGTFSTGTGPRSGTGLSENLRQGRRRERRSFFMPWGAPERAQDAGALLNVSEAQEAEKREQRPFLDKGGPLHPPRKSQQQTKKAWASRPLRIV